MIPHRRSDDVHRDLVALDIDGAPHRMVRCPEHSLELFVNYFPHCSCPPDRLHYLLQGKGCALGVAHVELKRVVALSVCCDRTLVLIDGFGHERIVVQCQTEVVADNAAVLIV